MRDSGTQSLDRTNARPTKIYVGAIVVAGGAALIFSVHRLLVEPVPRGWMILAALTLLSFVFSIKVPGIPAKISVSETFVFTSVLLFGTAAATVTVALDALIMSGWRHRHQPIRVLFNATEPTLSIWVASQLFLLMVGVPLSQEPRDATSLWLPVLVLSLTYFLLNSCLTAIAIGLQTGNRIITVWRTHFLWLALNYLGGASVALLIVQNSNTVNITTIAIILPLLVITYLTFKSSMGRIEDANEHVEHVNRMYMSTIETLAMAVDAKDQTTHGHIRRVQSNAVAVANALGLNDPGSIRSIEAAALLHDIGKLAVPEHILNKPGKLTTSEFEQMKTHAALGADILSATDFPYPVVPIVRHHHENWDGTGYPDGIAGLDIPMGARLLAVVDCFDALTSDRPYRQRMSEAEALTILQTRRGSMYDPLVVDTFTRLVQDRSIESEPELPQEDPQLHHDTSQQSVSPRGVRTVLNPDENVFAGASSAFASVTAMIAAALNRCVPNSIFVVYSPHETADYLVAICASKEAERTTKGLKIHVAQRLSGWVAANRATIANSDPRLDSPELSRAMSVRNALSTPILSGTILFGVLTVYRTSDALFSVSEIEAIESLSRTIAALLTEEGSHPRGLAGFKTRV